MPPTQYRPSRRNWVKLWTHEWLTGTVRWQLTIQQRAMWADLLALAGDSRFPGIVTPGEDGGKFIGYPPNYFSGLFSCPESEVVEAFEIFEKQDRIKVGSGGEIHIVNWGKYQSEYQEKRHRKQYKQKSAQVTTNVQQMSARLESEVEVEGEVEKKETPTSRFALPGWVPRIAWEGFMEMRNGLRPRPTDRAKDLLIAKLGRLAASGGDAEEILNQSTENGWKGLFPVQRANGRENSKAVAKQQRSEAALDTVLGGDAPVSTPSVRRLPSGTD